MSRAILLACVCTWCVPVQAEVRGAQTERLSGLSQDDLERLGPELARGPVALIEFADKARDQLPAINIALPIRASAATVVQVLTEPKQYPKFMPMLDSVGIVAKHDASVVYEWAWNLALLRMRGRNLMTLYPAAAGKADAATRITIDSQEGDLGRGRYLFRVHPRESESVLVMSLRLDLREANYVARQVAKAARSVNRSANIAMGFSMALHTRKEAERREQHARAAPTTVPALRKPSVDLARLGPLFSRGDLLLFDMDGDKLNQIGVLGVIAQNESKVQSVMHDATAFGSSLIAGSRATIVSQQPGVTLFDWTIDIPLFGVSGQMRMLDRDKQMRVDAVKGALRGGQWLFELTPVAEDATLVNGWARFDFHDTTWLLEKLVSSDVFLGEGMIGAAELMLMRAVRARASK